MKRIKKGLTIIIVILVSLIFINPINTNAETFYSDIQAIADSNKDIKVGNITFQNIRFEYDDQNELFNLYGTVNNNNDNFIETDIYIEYFDTNEKYVGNSIEKTTIKQGVQYFNIKTNIIKDTDINNKNIKYYRLRIITNEDYNPKLDLISGREYYIKDYNVDIKVNTNNTYDITEEITAHFNEPKHGIIRKIPLKNKITRLDGTTSKNKAQVLKLKVDNKYEISKEDGYYQIKIGSANTTIKGDQKYTIKYTYNIGKDPLKNKDEIYLNIIGTEWDTAIEKVKFKIQMPKEFDTSKLGFSYGYKGSTNTEEIKYIVDGNTIVGSFEEGLNSYQGITVRCELPEDYFKKERYYLNINFNFNLNIHDLKYILFPLILLLLSALTWFKYGKDEKVIETVEFYPPKGYNCIEVAYLYNGQIDDTDILALIFELANKGYVKIEPIQNKKKKYDDFKIIKIKDYDGNNINELRFLEGMFSSKTITTTIKGKSSIKEKKYKEVTSDDLYDNFYITLKNIKRDINTKENNETIFKSSTTRAKLLLIGLMIACILTIVPTLFIEGELLMVLLTLFSMLFIPAFTNNEDAEYGIIEVFKVIMCLLAAVIIGLFANGYSIYQTKIPISLLCLCGIIIFFESMTNRTKFGNEIYGKLSGLANFIKTTDKEKLEELTLKDAHYFYDILPYAIVLGVSTQLIDKVKDIIIKPPEWYIGTETFDISSFNFVMEKTMENLSAASSAPSSDSDWGDSGGGGSSGGGSSGGGSGGGGGSSW